MSALLIMACSGKKQPWKARAIDLYQGVMFDVLRKYMPAGDQLDVMIVSAEHGLLMADDEIAPYDRRMTKARADELLAKGLPDDLEFDGDPYENVFVACGDYYRRVATMYVRELERIGQISPTATITTVYGGIGQQRQQLGTWLRSLQFGEVAA